MAEQQNPHSFEQALARIEEIVTLLEGGAAPLEESMRLFHEAAQLAAWCNSSLQQAQLQVEQMADPQGNEQDS